MDLSCFGTPFLAKLRAYNLSRGHSEVAIMPSLAGVVAKAANGTGGYHSSTVEWT